MPKLHSPAFFPIDRSGDFAEENNIEEKAAMARNVGDFPLQWKIVLITGGGSGQ